MGGLRVIEGGGFMLNDHWYEYESLFCVPTLAHQALLKPPPFPQSIFFPHSHLPTLPPSSKIHTALFTSLPLKKYQSTSIHHVRLWSVLLTAFDCLHSTPPPGT